MVLTTLFLYALGYSKYTKQEIINQASDYGMVFKEEVLVFKEEEKEANNYGMLENKTRAINNEVEIEEKKIPDKKEVEIKIPRGATSESTARILKNYNIIPDEKKFANLLVTRRLDTKLQPGIYTFPTPTNEEGILKILFRKEKGK